MLPLAHHIATQALDLPSSQAQGPKLAPVPEAPKLTGMDWAEMSCEFDDFGGEETGEFESLSPPEVPQEPYREGLPTQNRADRLEGHAGL